VELTTGVRTIRVGLLLITIAAVLWGTVGVTTRALSDLSATNPLSVGFFRLAFAAPALLAAGLATQGRGLFRIARRDAALSALIGALLGMYQVCYFTAIGYAGVAVATLVTLCTAPVIAALLSTVLTKERIGRPTLLALAGALAGTALLVSPADHGAGGSTLAGVLFALGSAFGYAAVTVCGRSLAGRAEPLQINAIAFTTGALLLLALALPSGFVASYPALGWGLLLYLGLVPTALAFGLFLHGMRTTPATDATIVTLLEPLIATLLAWGMFGERLGPLGIVGAALLLGSLLVLYRGGEGRLLERRRAR
jgi:drug/metabolite transporter, DME family